MTPLKAIEEAREALKVLVKLLAEANSELQVDDRAVIFGWGAADITFGDCRRAFNYDFAKVRKKAGLPAHIKPLDIRRTANLEAALGDAKPEERARFLANTLDRNKRLEKTYTPETVELSLTIADKREIGRAFLKNAG